MVVSKLKRGLMTLEARNIDTQMSILSLISRIQDVEPNIAFYIFATKVQKKVNILHIGVGMTIEKEMTECIVDFGKLEEE